MEADNVDTETGQHREWDFIMHNPEAIWGDDTCDAPARRRPATVQAPLTNRTFLTTSRSRGYHSKSIAREEGRGKGQQTGIR